MARRIHLWLPALTLLALSACGGSESGFFSTVLSAGAGSYQAGASSSQAGSMSSSGSPGSAGSSGAGVAGQVATGGSSSGGAPSGGTSAGGYAGTNSTGGVAGSRAGAGAGGRAGAGAGGRAGAGAGGRAGAGGSGAAAGAAGSNSEPSCNDLQRQANQQLDAARVCNPNQEALQCTGTVSNLCNCEVPVQREESAETKAYLRTVKLLKEKDCVWACAAIACPSGNNAQCRASSTSNTSTGTCVATSHGPD